MPEAAADFEAIFRHCAAITSSIELDEVVRSTVESLEELLPSTTVTITIDASETHAILAADPADDSTLAVALQVGGETVGALRVVSGHGPFSARDRTRLVTITPSIASAMRNALFLARQRGSWETQRKLDAQKSSFIWMTAAGLDGPLDEVSKLAAQMREDADESLRDTAGRVLAEARQLAELVEEILTLSLMESSEIVLPSA
jgi:GAF domain-containing protein